MKDAFSDRHPIVNFIFYIGALVMGMCLIHPLFLLCSLVLSVAYYAVLKRGSWKYLLGMAALFVAVTVINPLFNPEGVGEHVLFTYFGEKPYTLESLCYGAAIAAMLVTVVITIYNITSVIILELFNDEGTHRIALRPLLVKLAKNPMLQGCCVGLACYLLGLRLPSALEKPISEFADMSSPLALFALGGTLQFKAIGKNLRYLVPTLATKLILLPLALVAIAYALGLRGVELFLVIAVFATPVASGSYPMAQNMGGDGELAGQLVFLSTVISVFTLFGWIFVLRLMCII